MRVTQSGPASPCFCVGRLRPPVLARPRGAVIRRCHLGASWKMPDTALGALGPWTRRAPLALALAVPGGP